MASLRFSNNASSTLAAGITSTETALTLASGGGANFVALATGDWQMATLENTSGGLEIIKITARSGDNLTVVRGQESTAALDFAVGTVVEARLTAGPLGTFTNNAATNSGFAVLGTAAGYEAVTLGARATATQYSGVSLGSDVVNTGNSAIAIGNAAQTVASGSVAIGISAVAKSSNAVAVGAFAVASAKESLAIASFPAIQRGGTDYYGLRTCLSLPSIIFSPPMPLGDIAAWQANTVYTDGDCVEPTTPNGRYYVYRVLAYVGGSTNTGTSGATEPTWPTYADGTVTDNTVAKWYGYSKTPFSLSLPSGAGGSRFYADEVGYICDEYSDITAAPFVSFGSAGAMISNQQLTGITAVNMRHRFISPGQDGATSIVFSVDTRATGASAPRFNGRFYARGVFFQNRG